MLGGLALVAYDEQQTTAIVNVLIDCSGVDLHHFFTYVTPSLYII